MYFTKMHGLGNDYIYVNGITEHIREPERLAVRLSDRHFGAGADGLILILPSKRADFRMDIYNADGSRAEMCGNGIRCLAKYVYDRGLTKKKELIIETDAGMRRLWLETDEEDKISRVTVDMGYPIFQADKIPIISEHTRVVQEANLNPSYGISDDWCIHGKSACSSLGKQRKTNGSCTDWSGV